MLLHGSYLDRLAQKEKAWAGLSVSTSGSGVLGQHMAHLM